MLKAHSPLGPHCVQASPSLLSSCTSHLPPPSTIHSRLPWSFRALLLGQLYPLIQEFSLVLAHFPVETNNFKIQVTLHQWALITTWGTGYLNLGCVFDAQSHGLRDSSWRKLYEINLIYGFWYPFSGVLHRRENFRSQGCSFVQTWNSAQEFAKVVVPIYTCTSNIMQFLTALKF